MNKSRRRIKKNGQDWCVAGEHGQSLTVVTTPHGIASVYIGNATLFMFVYNGELYRVRYPEKFTPSYALEIAKRWVEDIVNGKWKTPKGA